MFVVHSTWDWVVGRLGDGVGDCGGRHCMHGELVVMVVLEVVVVGWRWVV